MGPLKGVKVIEIAGIGPAPCAGMMLADLGADVILVERKTVNANAAATMSDRQKAIFNRGKRSIALDLKQPEAIDIVLGLLAEADVLIEGFRPGVMERLGLGPDVAMARNSKLIYGRLTGWGQEGPLKHAAGHDPNYIALSGALWSGGAADRPPTAPITLVGDLGGGTMMLLMGVMAGLWHAQRTGEGQVIDAAITDGSAYLSTLLFSANDSRALGDGWMTFGAPWNDTYACADGRFITICPLEPKFYAEFLTRLDLEEHPLFAEQWDKNKWPEAKAYLRALFLTRSRDAWCEVFEGTDACFAPVLDLQEAPLHPHNQARGTFLQVGAVSQPAPAPKFSHTQQEIGPIPDENQHADAILAELGMAPEHIADCKARGVL